MTTARAHALVTRWVRCYTWRMPGPVATRRRDEIAADLHDHIAHDRAHGVSDRRTALSILSRMARGVPADLTWRGNIMKSYLAVLAGALALTLVGVFACVYGAEDDSPGLVLIGLVLITAAFTGAVRTAHRRGLNSRS